MIHYLLCFLCAFSAVAATYHVRQDGTGDFTTIQTGVDALQPGDTLIISPGEYRESVSREGLGSMDATTTIRAETPGTVTLRGDVPAPEFRPVPGYRFVWVCDFPGDQRVHVVNELDTLTILDGQPNVPLLEMTPGAFYQDREAGQLYVSSSDLAPAPDHRYSFSVNQGHGLYLHDAQQVVIEGIATTGYNSSSMLNRLQGTMGATYGIFLNMSSHCVIRDCRAWLNGCGIGLNSEREDAGHNLIEGCTTWGNSSKYGWGDKGGITIHGLRIGNWETVRDCVSMLNSDYGINIYSGTSPPELIEERRNVIRDSLAWGNGYADYKIKTGHEHVHKVLDPIDPEQTDLSAVRGLDFRAMAASMEPTHRVAGPFVHSVTATTASLEWWTSVPGPYVISWGTGDELTHVATIDSAKFGTYSLTGLEPDTRYTFRLAAEKPFALLPAGNKISGLTISLRTAAERHQPTTYYVANDGDNANSGTSREEAWRTVQHAADQARPGDTILLAGGTYREAVHLRTTGDVDRPITFKAIPGEKVVFDGIERQLTYAFLACHKYHLRFDSLYFVWYEDTSPNVPYAYHMRGLNGAITLYQSDHVTVTRCFLNGYGTGYSPGLLTAIHSGYVTMRNCVITGAMSGGVTVYWDSPGAVIEHNVFLRNLISQTLIHVWQRHEGDARPILRRNIITDAIGSKSHALLLYNSESARELDNCLYVRLPPEERIWGRDGYVLADYMATQPPGDQTILADPQFAAAQDLELPTKPGYTYLYSDLLVSKQDLDFPDLFATNPEVVEREMGLQPEVFTDFHFNQQKETTP